MRPARDSFPEHPGLRGALIRALIALGRTNEAEDSLALSLALLAPADRLEPLIRTGDEYDTHGYTSAAITLWQQALQWLATDPSEDTTSTDNRRWRSNLLLRLGRLDETEDLALSLAKDSTELDYAGLLGLLRAMQGDSAEARRLSRRLAEWDAPYLHGMHTLWRARIAANLDSLEAVLELLDQATEEGLGLHLYYDWRHRDPFLRPRPG